MFRFRTSGLGEAGTIVDLVDLYVANSLKNGPFQPAVAAGIVWRVQAQASCEEDSTSLGLCKLVFFGAMPRLSCSYTD